MKKLSMFGLCGLVAAALLTGCSDGGSLGTATLGEYKGIPVTVESADVTDEELEVQIQSILSANPSYPEVDRPAEEGDIVNIDFTGYQDGVEFAGGSGTDQDVTLGSNSMIDGFEDGLIGTVKGEKKELNLTFPEDYKETTLAGQPVTFEVTVNAVKAETAATLDDEFVQRVTSYDTVEAFREGTLADLKAQKETQIENQKANDVFQVVLDNATVKLNRSAVAKRYNQELKTLTSQAEMFGSSLSAMAQNYGTDVGGLKEMVKASVEDALKIDVVVDTIAELENIVVDDADRAVYAEQIGMDVDSMVNSYGQDRADAMVKEYKVMRFLADNAVVETASQEATPAEAQTSEE